MDTRGSSSRRVDRRFQGVTVSEMNRGKSTGDHMEPGNTRADNPGVIGNLKSMETTRRHWRAGAVVPDHNASGTHVIKRQHPPEHLRCRMPTCSTTSEGTPESLRRFTFWCLTKRRPSHPRRLRMSGIHAGAQHSGRPCYRPENAALATVSTQHS